MSGGGKAKGRKTTEKTDNKAKMPHEPERSEANANGDEHGHDASEATVPDLRAISEQISGLNSTLTANWDKFKEDFKRDVKDELALFKEQIDQRLASTTLKLQDHERELEAACARVDELENWSAAANSALEQSLMEQKALRDKIDALESRSRRGNLRIYGVPEQSEAGSVIQFVERLIAREKLIEEGVDPQIQRAHRSLAPKPGPNAPPRSIIVNFLQYRIKETILRNAWKKKIQIGDRYISFDNDYTADVMQKRREYKSVKATLKERGVRFQTPFTRMRIHWDSGPQMYNSAADAMKDLRRRGLLLGQREEGGTGDCDPSTSPQRDHASPWKLISRHGGRDAVKRALERLQVYQHKPGP